MPYTIMFLTDERVTSSLSWEADLEPAKHYARDQLSMKDAERAEVWDHDCGIVYRYEPPVSRR
jgi:hypothetical protein